MIMKKNFIFTTDKETADQLKAEGFVCIEDNKNSWKFINGSGLKFSDKKNITYTNIVNM